jgi:hypothetical protein
VSGDQLGEKKADILKNRDDLTSCRGVIMIFSAKRPGTQVLLSPFVLKMNEGYLLGMAADPSEGSPCLHCCELWLTRRRIVTERMALADLPVRRELITELVVGNSAHVFYEISKDGTASKLDCWVYPHPNCECNRDGYVAPFQKSKKINFAFSPIQQLKCARFTTPSGNVWLTSALGSSPLTEQSIQVYAAGRDREGSRLAAVDEWMKRAVFSELSLTVAQGKPSIVEDFRSGKLETVPASQIMGMSAEGIGVGANREQALLSGLSALARSRTLRKYSSTMKSPMLMVGSNNWVRNRVPFYLLQQYDLHLLFYPNSTPSWVVGLAAISRVSTTEPPVFVFGSGPEILTAIDSLLLKMLERCRPVDWQNETADFDAIDEKDHNKRQRNLKLGLWWTHWIYRCPKISLKDVLHLEEYRPTIQNWKDYFNDGQERLSTIEMNTPLLPDCLRTLVKVHAPEEGQQVRNVNGIGTWASFAEAAL